MTTRHPLDGNAIAADEYYKREEEEQEQEEMDEDDYRQTWRGSRYREDWE